MSNFLIIYFIIYIVCGILVIRRYWRQIRDFFQLDKSREDLNIFEVKVIFTFYWPFIFAGAVIENILTGKKIDKTISKGT